MNEKKGGKGKERKTVKEKERNFHEKGKKLKGEEMYERMCG